jgi:hypothetical protein
MNSQLYFYILGVLISVISVLLTAIGYFLKRLLDKVDRMSDNLTELKIDMADVKPKVNLLWEHHIEHFAAK